MSHHPAPQPDTAAEPLPLSRFGLAADVLQKQIERDSRYAYWFTTGRCSPGAWAAVVIMLIGIGVASLCAVIAGAHQQLRYISILGAAPLTAVVAGQMINRLLKRRLSRLPRGLREYERAQRLRRMRPEGSETAEKALN